MRISKVIFICCFLLPFLASCTRDEIEDNSYPLAEYDGTGVLFRLKAEAFDDTGSATRTVDLTAPFDTLCAYVLKEGQIDIDREVKFPDPATIMRTDGSYGTGQVSLVNNLYLVFYCVKRTKVHRKNACVPLFLQRTLIGDM